MDAKELRLGNKVFDTKGNVNEINLEALTYIIKEPRNQVKPIPLTEEWLEKLGFVSKYKSCHNRWSFNGFSLDQASDEDDKGAPIPPKQEFFYDWTLEVKYIHHLQNLYFDHKSEELEIKEAVNEEK